jgi:hypothetical protein
VVDVGAADFAFEGQHHVVVQREAEHAGGIDRAGKAHAPGGDPREADAYVIGLVADQDAWRAPRRWRGDALEEQPPSASLDSAKVRLQPRTARSNPVANAPKHDIPLLGLATGRRLLRLSQGSCISRTEFFR